MIALIFSLTLIIFCIAFIHLLIHQALVSCVICIMEMFLNAIHLFNRNFCTNYTAPFCNQELFIVLKVICICNLDC